MDIWKTGEFTFPLKYISKNSEDIESLFRDIYPNTFPILFPSARSGIHTILSFLQITRQDLVFTLPFSSHCVLNTISYTGTPTTTELIEANAHIIYHQLGYTNKLQIDIPKKNLIEDSVDSIIENPTDLFPNDGRFEVLSLPKIFGTKFGGIVLTKSVADYENLKKIRNIGLKPFFHPFQKLLFSNSEFLLNSWSNNEPLFKGLPFYFHVDIYSKVLSFKRLMDIRKSNIESLKGKGFEFEMPRDSRLPTALIFEKNPSLKIKCIERNINYFHDTRFKACPRFALPILHSEIDPLHLKAD